MESGKRGKEVDIMSTMKPIQATPGLSGEDAVELLRQSSVTPTEKSLKKNTVLRSVLTNIRRH